MELSNPWPEGWRLASSVVRNHRLWELYLTNAARIAAVFGGQLAPVAGQIVLPSAVFFHLAAPGERPTP